MQPSRQIIGCDDDKIGRLKQCGKREGTKRDLDTQTFFEISEGFWLLSFGIVVNNAFLVDVLPPEIAKRKPQSRLRQNILSFLGQLGGIGGETSTRKALF